MIPAMEVHLERIDPDRNLWRWYRLSVRRTLFGDWTLMREWGRIGCCRGQVRCAFFDEEAQARAALSAVETRKLRRGYRSA